jgi:hypothetical protein
MFTRREREGASADGGSRHARDPRRERERRHPLSPAGKAGAVGVTFGLVSMAAFTMAVSADELLCRGLDCEDVAALAGIAWMLAAAAAGLGIWTWIRVVGRPVAPDGEAGWRWVPGLLFVAGAVALVHQVPSLTCPPGYSLDAGFGMCLTSLSRRDAESWVRLKVGLVALGVLGGVTLVPWKRIAPVGAIVAVAAWSIGMGWLVLEVFGGAPGS